MASRERMYAMFQATRHVVAARVPGDLVECGVWRGGSSMIGALTLLGAGDHSRRLWLYDTFAGMPAPTGRDVAPDGRPALSEWARNQRGARNEWCYAPLEEVRDNLLATGIGPGRLELVAGRVQDTLPGRVPSEIALLRLDTDWYESTRHELTHLFGLLSPGGVLIVDDYGHWQGARQAVDEYFQATGVHMLRHRIDYTGRIGIKAQA
jgi:hypothetical protein